MSLKYRSLAGPKHIAVSSTTANQIMYVVPQNRRFKGTVYVNGSTQISINNGNNLSFGTTAVVLTDFVLGPGSFLKSINTNGVTLIGIEE